MNQYPFFSIIIPTYNRPERLQTCLTSLTRLSYPRDRFEVIVVDDGSKTPLTSIVAPFQQSLNLTLIRQENAGPATARNTGAWKATGQFLAFTDDDCIPASDWLDVLASRLQQSPHCMVGGYTINALPESLYSTTSQMLIDYLYEYYNTHSENASFFASNNIAMATEHFRSLGGFDTSFPLAAAEDRELCDRWLRHGYSLQYVPNARVFHTHHLTLRSFCRQHFNYGRGAFHFHKTRARAKVERIKVEPMQFYINLVTYPFKINSQLSKAHVSVLLLVSQVTNVMGWFYQFFKTYAF